MSLRTLLNTLRASLVRKQLTSGSIRGRRSSSRVCQTLEVRALLSVDIAPIIDINQTANAGSSAPQDLVDVEGTVYFIASTTATGAELWKSDGTANGTTLVKDIKAGSDLSNASYLTNVNGTLFFRADDGIHSSELWKSDGTTSGTTLVKDIVVGGGSGPAHLINVNGTLFFQATDGDNGGELWKSDGTEGGTTLVKDIRPGPNPSGIIEMTNVNGTLYFRATDGTSGLELWKSDGTAAGTVLVKDIRPGADSSVPEQLTNVDGTLYFVAEDATSGRELWKSDGTASGTTMVKNITAGTGGSFPRYLTNVNGTLFFQASETSVGRELWKSDGTESGTVLVEDIMAGSHSANPSSLTNVNGTLYFQAGTTASGSELWKSDGTASGTTLVKDIIAGTIGASPGNLINVNGELYFSANDGINGNELWKSDGTAVGTALVSNINSSTTSSYPFRLTNVSGTLYFIGNDGVHGLELWKSNGTDAGTVLVQDIFGGTLSASLANLVNVSGTMFFSADNGILGTELWKSDGTAAGTILVKDIQPGAGSSQPSSLTNLNGVLYFVANDGSHGHELWKSDGTTAGTVMVKDIRVGAASSGTARLFNMSGSLYFTANDGSTGYELWKSNGTSAGTTLVKDIRAGANTSNIFAFANVNGTLYFSAYDDTNGRELWKSNGTTSGTVIVKNIRSGVNSSSPYSLINVNGTLFFSANDGTNGEELWKSNGTSTGTVLVSHIEAGANGSSPRDLTNVAGTLYFGARTTVSGNELWRSNGTAAGTMLVKDINPGASSSVPRSLVNVNGTLFFSAYETNSGLEVWKSDGTSTGTGRVKDIVSGLSTSVPNFLTNVNGTLYFSAFTTLWGNELWRSDGTEEGTQNVLNIAKESGAANPRSLTVVDDKLFFVATTDSFGEELYVHLLLSPPSDLSLSTTVLDENRPAGSVVGTLTSSDENLVENFTYTLVSGTGDTDNSSFSIIDDELVTAAVLDFENQSSYDVRIRTTDSSGLWFEKTLTILLNDLDEVAPGVLGTSFTGSGIAELNTESLLVTFSETITGGDTANNYRLQRAGADRILGNADDVTISMSSADINDAVVTLHFPALPADVYRLQILDSITDAAGNFLDGDLDGTAGGHWIRDFVVGTSAPVLTSPDNFFFRPQFGGVGSGQLLEGPSNAFDGMGQLQIDGVGFAPDVTAEQFIDYQEVTATPAGAIASGGLWTTVAGLTATITVEESTPVRIDSLLSLTSTSTISGAGQLRFTINGVAEGTSATFGNPISFASASLSGTTSTGGSHSHSVSGSTGSPSSGSNHTHTVSGSVSSSGNHTHSVNLSLPATSRNFSVSASDWVTLPVGTHTIAVEVTADSASDFAGQQSLHVVQYKPTATSGPSIQYHEASATPTGTIAGTGAWTTVDGLSTTFTLVDDTPVNLDTILNLTSTSNSFPNGQVRFAVNGVAQPTASTFQNLLTFSSTTISGTTSSAGAHSHTVNGVTTSSSGHTHSFSRVTSSSGAHTHTVSLSLPETVRNFSTVATDWITLPPGTYTITVEATADAVTMFSGQQSLRAVLYNPAFAVNTSVEYQEITAEPTDTIASGLDWTIVSGLDTTLTVDGTTPINLHALLNLTTTATNNAAGQVRFAINGQPLSTASGFGNPLALSSTTISGNTGSAGTHSHTFNAVTAVAAGHNHSISATSSSTGSHVHSISLAVPATTRDFSVVASDWVTLPQGTYVVTVEVTSDFISAFADQQRLQVVQYVPTAIAQIADQNQTFITGTDVISGLSISRSITVPDSGLQNFVRTVDSFTNPTGSPVSIEVRLIGNLGSDNATTVFATSDGDLIVEPTDLWFGTDDQDGSGSPAIVHLIRGRWGTTPASSTVTNDNVEWTWNLTLNPGETQRLAYFSVVENTRAEAIDAVNAIVSNTGFSEAATAFLAPSELDSLVNFQFNEAPTAIQISSNEIRENVNAGAAVGQFVTDDPNPLDSHVYTLTTGSGSEDNDKFEIVGDILKSKRVFDFEDKSTYSIRVRSADLDGLTLDRVFNINVLNQLDGTAGSDVFTLSFSQTSVSVVMAIDGGVPVNQGVFPLNTPLELFDLLSDDTVVIVGTSGNDLWEISNQGLFLNTVEILINGPAHRTLKGVAGDDTYRFDADTPLGNYSLIETGAGVDTIDFSLTTTQSVSINLGTSATQVINTNLSLTLNSSSTLENAIGGEKDDTLNGNSLHNHLSGRGGNDWLNGRTGNDTLIGGQGDDLYLFNTPSSGMEADVVIESANQGTDTINFASIKTPITLNLGTSNPQNVHANRTLKINSFAVIENATGGSAGDTIFGNALNNKLVGNNGNDQINGGAGSDILIGGQGDDIYRFNTPSSGTEADVVTESANQGTDTLHFASITTPITLNLGTSNPQNVHANRTLKLNSYAVIENATGGSAGDTIFGNALNNKLLGNNGNDQINGRAGSDILIGGQGDDNYRFSIPSSGTEADVVTESANQGTDTLNFASIRTPITLNLGTSNLQNVHANRTLKLNSHAVIENATGGSVGDTIYGNALNNKLLGNNGNDQLNGRDGSDILIGGQGDDIYLFDTPSSGTEADVVTESANQGIDTLNFASITTPITLKLGTSSLQNVHANRTLKLNSYAVIENAIAGSGNDKLTGNTLHNVLVGNAGNDQLIGSSGRDILIGGQGRDNLTGGSGDDILIAGFTASDLMAVHLNRLLTLWISSSPYEARIANLRAGTGTPTASLKAKQTVLNDARADDLLTGGTGDDWFLLAMDDVITDLVNAELTDLL